MTDTDTTIDSWATALSSPARLTLYTTAAPESDEMKRFGDHLAQKAGEHLSLSIKKGEAPLPFFETEQGLRFFALPGKKLLDLLLYAIKGEPDPIASNLKSLIEELTLPTTLDLFVAESCPFCPHLTRQLITLGLKNPQIHLSVYDGSFFRDEAEKRGVQSAPTLIYDADIRWSGQFNLVSAMEMVTHRKPEELSANAIQALLEEGGASRVATMMANAQKPFDSLNTLLAHEKWSVRLGAMVVMEELSETHPAIVSQTATALLSRWESLSPPALGDIIYIAGLSGDSSHLSTLQTILTQSTDEALREATEEAIEELKEKSPC